ncbi:MAG: hypothetical protein NVS3B20_12580 [Polyangiales bacterium]
MATRYHQTVRFLDRWPRVSARLVVVLLAVSGCALVVCCWLPGSIAEGVLTPALGDAFDTRDSAVSEAPDVVVSMDTTCPPRGGSMVRVDHGAPPIGTYCMDRYEVDWNQFGSFYNGEFAMAPCEAGPRPVPKEPATIPVTGVDGCHAEAFCRSVGKRLCTNEEWTFACESNDSTHFYPYGKDFQEGRCRVGLELEAGPNAVDADPACVTPSGIYNLVGNVAELVVVDRNEKFWHCSANGGDFADRRLTKTDPPDASAATCTVAPTYYCTARTYAGRDSLGFRCCAD